METNSERSGPMTNAPDPRVDLVLFFVPPHRLKEADVSFMARLAELAPVVPLLAKADSMTSAELAEFRAHVRASLRGHGALLDYLLYP